MDTAFEPFELLLEQHVAFADLFARHQEALLDRRFEDASRLLEEYGERLREHIALEESCLLPKCAALDSVRWPPQVYRAEHRRIEQLLARTGERLRREGHLGMTAAALISILDEERTLKRLVEHHHEREETALFSEVRSVAGNAA
ncbi:MAG TPA: hemerythrin domain-containing protein [Steroidobacteraceae bacterium]